MATSPKIYQLQIPVVYLTTKQRTIVLSAVAIAGVALLFASGPITGNQQAFAQGPSLELVARTWNYKCVKYSM